MKRIIAVLLSAAMCICLFGACGGTGAGDVSDAPAEETVNPAIAGAGQPTAEPSDAENPSDSGDAPSSGGLDRSVYREISIGSTDTFSTGHFDVTAKLNSTYNCYSAFLAYDTLIYIDPETHQYKSDILTEFYWDDDLPGVVLTLRDDVYFSNGDQMTAEDILYTYQRQTAVDRQRDQFLIMLIDQAEISEDGLTIKIPFSQDYGPWRTYVGGNSGIMNKSWVEEHGGDNCDFYDPAMVCGSGPYKVTDFQIDSYTVYEKRDDWWMADEAPDGYATYDKITVYYYTDATTMMVDYEIGTIDVALGITESDYNRVVSDSSLGTVGTMPSKSVCLINLDVGSESPMSDVNLRKAMCLGTDTETLSILAYGALQSPAESTLSVWNPAHIDGCTYDYDPEEAKRIIDENGLSGTTLKWIATPGSTATIAEGFQNMMSQIGVNIEIETYDFATATVMWLQPGATNFQCDGNSFGNTANDAHNQYQMMSKDSIWPACQKSGYDVSDLIDKARYSTDEAERGSYYEELQQYLYDNYLLIPLCEWASALCHNDSVASCTPTETSLANLRFIMPAE